MGTNRTKRTIRPKPAGIDSPGVIHRDAVYTKLEFMRRLGIDEDAWKGMRRRGLKVRYDGKRACVLGSEYLDYLAGCPDKPGGRGESGIGRSPERHNEQLGQFIEGGKLQA